MSPIEIERWNSETDGELTEQKLRMKLESRGYRISRYVYPPGTYFPEHAHTVHKINAVVCGRFRVSLCGRSVILQPGDWLKLPRGILHSAEVVGDEPVISLDAAKADVY